MSGMRILSVSDTHRRDGNFRRVLEKTGPIDMLIHLGDTEGSEAYFREWVNNDVCVIHVVRGNNDFFSFCDREKEISIGRYRALLTHGHMYAVFVNAIIRLISMENSLNIATFMQVNIANTLRGLKVFPNHAKQSPQWIREESSS